MKEFLRAHRGEFISLGETIARYPPVPFHGLGLPCVFAQNRLHEKLAQNRVFFLPGLLVVLDTQRTKLYHYDPEYRYDFARIRTPALVASPVQEALPAPRWREYPQPEYLYDPAAVLDRGSYRNGREYRKRVTYPLNLMDRYAYRTVDVTAADLPLVKRIHDAWVAHKLASGSVYAMMFSKTRYYRLIEDYLHHYRQYFDATITLGLVENRPFCVDANYFFKGMAYGMCGFSLYFAFDEYPSHLAEGRNLVEFRMIRDRGCGLYTTGIAETKHLKTYKTEFPHRVVPYYHYLQG